MGGRMKTKRGTVLSTTNAESRGMPDSGPVSLLAFLQAENRRLQNIIAQLERDIIVSREILQRNRHLTVGSV
jgi:hypothetical protein